MTPTPTIFDVLNARYATTEKIAHTFIAPSHFRTLLQPGNTVLVGARGTGKTTLLKMLKLPAFQIWGNAEKDDYLPLLNYITAFIANDRNWSERINDFAAQFESDDLQNRARIALVSNQALRAIVRSASEIFNNTLDTIPLMEPFLKIDRLSAEIKFSLQLSSSLFKNKVFYSTADIDRELGFRVDQLIEDTNALRVTAGGELEVARNNRWIFGDFLAPLHNAVVSFREATKSPEIPWCLCFDELELAHESTRNLLFTHLRGADPVFYLKLATVPFIKDISAFQTQAAPTAQHDFSVVELWNVRKDQSDRFMYQLANSALGHNGITNASLETVLGNSFDYRPDTLARQSKRLDPSRGNRPYSRQSPFFSYFLELADRDPTFREYLEARGIGVHDFFQMSEERRAAIFRKVQNIVVVRSAFRPISRESNVRSAGTVSRRRSSRGFIYSGAQKIVELCDNNPRFLLAILGPLLREYKSSLRVVKKETQLDSVTQVTEQIWSVLNGEAINPPYVGMISVGALIRRLGNFFEAEIHRKGFNSDPVLSFKLSAGAPPRLVQAIGFGIREGALLLEGEYTGSYLRDGLADKRLRLAYIFAPYFLLPLMLGRSRVVEAILNFKQGTTRNASDENQTSLFGSENGE